ncbi:Dyp-type peroxidase [Rhizobium lusitanum]|uniref:Dyp-type peroxidase n=1 Tax=Rhizobium lusitanum TaxID=293958 RepID=A0A6L9U939_9HYPH|nr:Dyp-type peroxidase [Rhizobium lusitanum]NEI72034.1 Dyp-type peroxidase [Rhizobium lusitanum]
MVDDHAAKEFSLPTTVSQDVPARSQAVDARLTRAAIFLVVTIDARAEPGPAVRGLCANLSSLIRGVGFRAADGGLSCIMGIGRDAWDRLFGAPRPKELHPFREIRGVHHAPSTPGDLLFHIRAARMDLCFELAAQIMKRLAGVASVADEVHGFRYFDDRDLLGFVDGTENPVEQAAIDATLIGPEDPAFAGGSYVIVQKYLHDIGKWNAIPVEQQEKIVGREKLSDIELDEAAKPSFAHNVLTNIEENGEQLQILRDNMPFGDVGKGEFGTYFIGYARSPARIERMLDNMFVGQPPGNYDRLLDVSKAVTGSLYFVPSADFLDAVTPEPSAGIAADDDQPPAANQSPPAPKPSSNGSLRIGSLKDEVGHE